MGAFPLLGVAALRRGVGAWRLPQDARGLVAPPAITGTAANDLMSSRRFILFLQVVPQARISHRGA